MEYRLGILLCGGPVESIPLWSTRSWSTTTEYMEYQYGVHGVLSHGVNNRGGPVVEDQ